MTLAPPSTESRYPPPVIEPMSPSPEARDDLAAAIRRSTYDRQPSSAKQVAGTHYLKLSPQPWDVVDAWNLSFYEGNVLKYLARWKEKGGVEDLEKARHYLDRLIEKERACKP